METVFFSRSACDYGETMSIDTKCGGFVSKGMGMKNFKTTIGAAIFSVVAGAASAASVSVEIKNVGDFGTITSGWTSTTQDFEALGTAGGRREVGTLATNVGTFKTLGGTGTGGTVKDSGNNTTVTNTGTQLALRNGTVYGRTNVAPTGGAWFLDSNDTFGMRWDVSLGGGLFNKLVFALTDATDVGAFLRIIIDGQIEEVLNKNIYSNGVTKLVVVDFGKAVKEATIELANFTNAAPPVCTRVTSCRDPKLLNDGFSIDGIQVSAVPLPAGVLLLGSALAGFGALKRRRAARA
jgi:hypothetical protein